MNTAQLQTAAITAKGLSDLILVTPNVGYQAQAAQSKNGQYTQQGNTFLFHYEEENKVTLESDVTDHYIEDNSAIQDHVALKPEMVNVSGFIGELNNLVDFNIANQVGSPIAAQTLNLITEYQPLLTVGAIEAYNAAFQAYQTAINLYNSVAPWLSGDTQNKQQYAFQLFYGYYKARTLFTIQTPWAVFNDMIIKSCNAVQDKETRIISNFEITFKKMRFAKTLKVQVDQNSTPYIQGEFKGRYYNQASPVVNLGTQNPEPSGPVSSILGGG